MPSSSSCALCHPPVRLARTPARGCQPLPLSLAGGVEALGVGRDPRFRLGHQHLLALCERRHLGREAVLGALEVGGPLGEPAADALLGLAEGVAELGLACAPDRPAPPGAPRRSGAPRPPGARASRRGHGRVCARSRQRGVGLLASRASPAALPLRRSGGRRLWCGRRAARASVPSWSAEQTVRPPAATASPESGRARRRPTRRRPPRRRARSARAEWRGRFGRRSPPRQSRRRRRPLPQR